jgi:transglutaminase-like putative cysteine protease
LDPYLAASEIVDWRHPAVLALATELGRAGDAVEVAGRCFRWVRDEVRHSGDHPGGPITCSASEVLFHREGFCYAKSHLLAALLRANGIPAGFGYQRLSLSGDGPPFCLHGFNSLLLPDLGWHRADARGNRDGIETRFEPPREWLAFTPRLPGETTFATRWPEPLPAVVTALRSSRTGDELSRQWPDHA